jgi:hypothetical protein
MNNMSIKYFFSRNSCKTPALQEKPFKNGKRPACLFFFFCFALFLSCRTESNKKTVQVTEGIEFYRQEIFVPLWNKDEVRTAVPAGTKAPSLHITLSLPKVSGKAEDLEVLFRNLFYRGMDSEGYAGEQIRKKTLEYQGIKEDIRGQDGMILSDTLNWYYEEKFELETISPRFLIFSRNRAEYTGGAHGNYGKEYFVLNREKAELISLKDIIKEESRQALTEKLNKTLRQDWDLDESGSLEEHGFLVSRVELTENFFLTSQGLGFHWDPYEIGPYVMGSVEVTIPYGKIGDILNPLGHSLARELGTEIATVISDVFLL